MTSIDYVGKLAYSTSGRDKDKLFIILSIINNEYVYISDGELRKVEKPKKKKLKHLNIINNTADDIKACLLSGGMVSNSTVKKYLQLMNSNEEV